MADKIEFKYELGTSEDELKQALGEVWKEENLAADAQWSSGLKLRSEDSGTGGVDIIIAIGAPLAAEIVKWVWQQKVYPALLKRLGERALKPKS
jgi:hypothetical protein